MTANLSKIAGRVEAAVGADRELDARIAATLRVGTEYGWAFNYPLWIPQRDGRVALGVSGPSFAAPAYTASLDAAMTLVPEGWRVQGLFQRNCDLPNWIWKAELWHPEADSNMRGIGRNADIAALALTAACLRALRASEPATLDEGESG